MTAPATPLVRTFDVRGSSTRVFGRVQCSARNHHFIVDGPTYNNCPGEELTPPEVFLAAVASCGVELLHVLAKDDGVPLTHVDVDIQGKVDRSAQPRTDVTLFTSVRMRFTISGANDAQAAALVAGFRRR